MEPEHLRRALLATMLLGAGLALAASRTAPEGGPIADFGRAVWSARRADLVIQLGLMLVGAFGIRALLPAEGDEEDAEEDSVDDSFD